MMLDVRLVAIDFAPLPSHRPVDARIRADDDQAGQKEADEEQELLDGATVFAEDGARECWRIEAELAPEAE